MYYVKNEKSWKNINSSSHLCQSFWNRVLNTLNDVFVTCYTDTSPHIYQFWRLLCEYLYALNLFGYVSRGNNKTVSPTSNKFRRPSPCCPRNFGISFMNFLFRHHTWEFQVFWDGKTTQSFPGNRMHTWVVLTCQDRLLKNVLPMRFPENGQLIGQFVKYSKIHVN